MDEQQTDRHIIDLFFARNEQAIEETDRRYGGFCMRISLGILEDRLDAEECLNDTYLKAWNAIPPTRPRSLRAFLAKIIRNLSLHRLEYNRAVKRNKDFDLSLDELSECIPMRDEEADALPELLNRFLDTLPETECRLFCGRYWHGHSVKELARGYGLTPKAVTMRLSRTREKLRTYLNERGYHL